MKRVAFVFCLLAVTAMDLQSQPGSFPKLAGPYLGQKPPGTTPEKFAPGIVSTESHEFSSCFSPDGNEFYFTRRHPEIQQNVIMYSRLVNKIWTAPEVAPFVDTKNEFTFEPFITPDNKRLYFQSGRASDGALHMFTMYVERTEKGWGKALDPGEVFNPDKTMHVSATKDGTIYTTDISEGMTTRTNKGRSGPGTECLGMMRIVNGKYEKLEKLGPPLNKGERSQHPWIAPDESYMVYTVPKPGQPVGSSLFYAERKADGTWSDPKEIKLEMDAGQPFISSDGKYLFFSRNQQSFWIDAAVIEDVRLKGSK